MEPAFQLDNTKLVVLTYVQTATVSDTDGGAKYQLNVQKAARSVVQRVY